MRSFKTKVHAALAVLALSALAVAGCGESSAGKQAEKEFDRNLRDGVAEQIIEEEGFSHSAAQEAREAGEANGLSPRETAEMGAIAKHMGR